MNPHVVMAHGIFAQPARGGGSMIVSMGYLLIYLICTGLLLMVLAWIVENILKVPIPLIVKQAVGIIALILVGIYLARLFGVA